MNSRGFKYSVVLRASGALDGAGVGAAAAGTAESAVRAVAAAAADEVSADRVYIYVYIYVHVHVQTASGEQSVHAIEKTKRTNLAGRHCRQDYEATITVLLVAMSEIIAKVISEFGVLRSVLYIYIYISAIPLRSSGRVEVLCSPFGDTRVREASGP